MVNPRLYDNRADCVDHDDGVIVHSRNSLNERILGKEWIRARRYTTPLFSTHTVVPCEQVIPVAFVTFDCVRFFTTVCSDEHKGDIFPSSSICRASQI